MSDPLIYRRSPVDLENRRERVVLGVKHAPLPISIVIISYNSREDLHACLTSLEAEPWSEVIVVDNASSDGSEEIVRQGFPKMRLIKSHQNDGYGAAANLGIASCSSK